MGAVLHHKIVENHNGDRENEEGIVVTKIEGRMGKKLSAMRTVYEVVESAPDVQ